MLKNKIVKRILLVVSCLFIILIIYIFPTKEKEIKTVQKKDYSNESIIYLKDQNNYLGRVSIYIKENDKEKKIKEIIKYLTINSPYSNYIKNGFNPLIPENTKLLSVSIDKSLVKLNFSKEFLNIKEESEEKLLSSIIYSLTSIDCIDSISIYVEDNLLDKMPVSKKTINPILTRSFGINKKYDVTNLKGTTSTTIYYLSKQDNYYYYVPVTMINNNQSEKMEIIINELSSKASYQTGLISYLKASKELNYKLNSDIMEVSLKKELFNNLNNSNLLETVIYSMNLSIKDNYNVKEVIYKVDDNLYKNYFI